jgi:uncharacterized protein YecE (DUF72 family)
MNAHIGTSGWQYAYWKKAFYPEDIPQSRWLEYYTTRFSTVEINNTFYRLPERSTFESWAARTPDDFIVALKASRYLTHMKRLREPSEPVGRMLDRLQGLGNKLGPILMQLPPQMPIDLPALDETLSCFPKGMKVAVEIRNSTWFVDELAELLTRHNTALCLADSPHRETPLWRTADWGYIRFHEGKAQPPTSYGRRALATWAERLKVLFSDAELFAYFDNDLNACAPHNAAMLEKLMHA